jgi:alginate O-acetyltransferase complex protein AlgJ
MGAKDGKAGKADEPKWNGQLWSRLIRDGKVVQGKGGWLFLAYDSSEVLRQHTGDRTLSPEQIEQWRVLLEERTDRLAQMGSSYTFLVAPDTHSVYPERLPDEIVPTAERPIHKLMRRLEESKSPAKLIYPLTELVAKKHEMEVCSPFDTHWSEFGAFVAYTRLLDELRQQVPVRQIAPGHVLYYTRMMPGELSVKLGFDDDVEQLASVLYWRARLIEDNCVFNKGSYVVLECDEAPPTKCVLFGDSYSPMLMRFLAESFRRLVFAHMPTVDYELVERERPDVVVSLLAERFLIEVPDDSKGVTVEDLARPKLEKGNTRPRLPLWDRRPSPHFELVEIETVERIRAHLLSRGRDADAVFISLVAYAGVLPRVARRLRWQDVAGETVTVPPIDEDGDPRTVRLIEPLAEDLAQWRRALGEPDDGLLFTSDGWEDWHGAVFGPAAAAAGADGLAAPELRHCLATVLVRTGAGWEEIAEQTGMTPEQSLALFGHLVDDVYAHGPVPAAEQIRVARQAAETATVGAERQR